MKVNNPILPGFYPDPCALRVGRDWYVATSTFEWFPGVEIHHSVDLLHWDLVARPLAKFFPARSYGVVMRKGRLPSPQARAFMDLIQPDLFARRDYYDSGHSER